MGVAVVIATGILRGYVDYQKQVTDYMGQHKEYGSLRDEVQQPKGMDYQRKFAESTGFLFFEEEEDDTREV